MGTNFTVSVDEVSCPVCRDVFTYPVLLPCSHSVCKDCLQQYWRAGCRKCPLCRRVCPPGTEPPVNLALKNLCERFHQEQEAGGDAETLCSLHGEKLKLFCLVDKQPICADCVPNLHDLHKCCHLKVAVHDHKLKMKAALKPLQEKLENFMKISETTDETLQHIKSHIRHTETQIKEDFLELHQFLHDEETARIAALRAEGVRRSLNLSRKMDDVAQKMEALSATIKAIEQEMGKHDVQFLQSYNKTMKQAQCTVQTPDVSGVLINVAKHLGNLKFQVCQKMAGMAKYTPVILDPNTACPSLTLSKDLTSVKTGQQNAKSNVYLFGSQGFSSGKHQWDVEVMVRTAMHIGIIKESEILGRASYNQTSQACVLTYAGGCQNLDKKSIRRGLVRIRVLVDCDQRTVSLFDVYGNKTLHTKTHTLTGKLFPFFHFVYYSELEFLKILPATVKVIAYKSVH